MQTVSEHEYNMPTSSDDIQPKGLMIYSLLRDMLVKADDIQPPKGLMIYTAHSAVVIYSLWRDMLAKADDMLHGAGGSQRNKSFFTVYRTVIMVNNTVFLDHPLLVGEYTLPIVFGLDQGLAVPFRPVNKIA